MPKRAKNTRVMAAAAELNRGFLKNRRSSMGKGVRSSQAANRSRNATPMPAATRVGPPVQPWVGASMMA